MVVWGLIDFICVIIVIFIFYYCENFFFLVLIDFIVISNRVYYVWKIFIRVLRWNINSEMDIFLKNWIENNCKL